MGQNSLTIKHQCDAICISGSEAEIAHFIKWVNDYKHGTCHESTITCKTPSDMKACNFKAIRMKLSPSQYSVNNKNQ